MYVQEPSLEARTAGKSLQKFKLPNIFPLTDLPNIILTKFSRMSSEKRTAVQYVIAYCNCIRFMYVKGQT